MKFKELLKELIEMEDDFSKINYDNKLSAEDKKDLVEHLKFEILKLSEEVFQASIEEMKYWNYCSIKVYRETYSKRLQQFLDDDESAITNEAKFIESELSRTNSLIKSFSKYYHPIITKALEKRILFLEGKQNETSEEVDLLDFSDLKANEKIVFLHKLGVLGFLKEKTTFSKPHKLAEVLSTFTGEKTTTLQSYLNPIYSEGTEQKNNPLLMKNVVQRVDKRLTDMGFLEK